MLFSKKFVMLLIASITLLTPTLSTSAQDNWPERTVKIIAPYEAGGPNDLSARLLGEQLRDRLGQTFVIENKAGAGTAVGNSYVSRAPADGYTVLYAAAPYSTLEALQDNLNYDPRKDLKPVAMSALVPLFLVVNADSPFKSVQDLIDYGKSNADGLTFGSPGHGSLPHLAVELLLRNAGVPGLAIHYKGDVPAYTDLVAGRLDATLTAITAALPHIQSGKLRVLGVASEQPSAIYPDAQPLKNQGLPNVVAAGWYGFMVPSGTPTAIVDKLDNEINLALNDPAVRQRLLSQGMDAHPSNQTEFEQFITSEMDKWSAVIREAGIKDQ